MAVIPKKQNALQTLQNRQAAGQPLGANQQARLTKLENRFNPAPASPQIPKAPPTGGGVKAAPVPGTQTGQGFQLGKTVEELNAQKAGLKGANRIAMVDNEIARLNSLNQPAANPAPQPEATPVPAPVATPPAETAMPQPSTFKSTYDFLPAQMTDDPIYKANLERGNERINRLMAKRGLINSGAEIEAQQNLERDLAADSYGRQIQTAANDAGRFDSGNQFNSNFSANREDAQWDRMFRGTQLALDQSPMQYAYGATGTVSGLQGELGNKISGQMRDNYGRVSAPRQGGVAGPGQFIPPMPSGPDYSNIDLLAALQGSASNQGYGNAIINTLPYISKLF